MDSTLTEMAVMSREEEVGWADAGHGSVLAATRAFPGPTCFPPPSPTRPASQTRRRGTRRRRSGRRRLVHSSRRAQYLSSAPVSKTRILYLLLCYCPSRLHTQHPPANNQLFCAPPFTLTHSRNARHALVTPESPQTFCT